jgi:hypothetical protein
MTNLTLTLTSSAIVEGLCQTVIKWNIYCQIDISAKLSCWKRMLNIWIQESRISQRKKKPHNTSLQKPEINSHTFVLGNKKIQPHIPSIYIFLLYPFILALYIPLYKGGKIFFLESESHFMFNSLHNDSLNFARQHRLPLQHTKELCFWHEKSA